MMAFTHAAFAVAATSVSIGTSNPLSLGLCAAASQLPDVDTSHSTVGRMLLPLSRRIESRYPHRSITHSFGASIIVGILFSPLLFLGGEYWAAIFWGYTFGWFADVFTKSGTVAFWPNQSRLVIPGNPKLRLATNSPAEFFLLILLLLISFYSININSSGGLLRAFNVWLGTPNGAVELVNQELDHYRLLASIEGRSRISSQRIAATFEVIKSINQSDLLVKDNINIYQAGTTINSQILANRIFVKRDYPIITTVQNFTITGDLSVLSALPSNATLSGQITTDDAYGLVSPSSVLTYNTLKILFTGNNEAQIIADSASQTELVALVGNRQVQGQLIARSYVRQ